MNNIGRNDLCPCGSKLEYRLCCLNTTLMAAYEYMQDGRYPEAEVLCRQAFVKEAGNADVLHLSGLIYHKLKDYDRAIQFIKSSIGASPAQPAYYCNLGDVYRDMKQFDEAVSCYRKALELDPVNAEALNNMGVNLNDAGMPDEAAAVFQKAIMLKPGYAVAHYNLGDALKKLDKKDGALASYKRSFAIDPNLAATMCSTGYAYQKDGKLREAEFCYLDLIAIKPDHAEAYVGLGACRFEQGRLDEAIDSYRRALSIDPDNFWAHNNLGTALFDRGFVNESIASYRKALLLKPDAPNALLGLGNVLSHQKRFDEAVAAYEKALSIKPDYLDGHSNLLLTCQYIYPVSNEEVFARSIEFGRHFETKASRKPALPGHGREQGRGVRIGLVSADLSNHPVGYFLESALRHMDRDAFTFIAYANQFHFDDLSERIKPLFSDWVWVRGMSDAELAARIRADGIDILIDLSGHTAYNRLPAFALKPAPVQVTWIGYANTTGMTSIDYILADPITVPVEEEKFYTEKVWRLPETYLCFTPPDADVSVGALPSRENGRFTFGCFNNTTKINDTVIACWARIMEAVPNSQLFLKYGFLGQQTECDDFIERFGALGIDAGRLRFEGKSSRDDYLAAYRQVDLALDPFPFPGATTTCEAAWMGVPTLTLRMARGIVGHNGELIMKSMGLDDWVAGSIGEYVEKAIDFARDTEILAGIRSHLRQRLLESPLCDGERFAGHLAQAFTGMLGEAAAS